MWWVDTILEIDDDEGDFQINFMHPPGPTKSFTWPSRPDICWVSSLHMLCKIHSPKTITGRTCRISYSYYKTISQLSLAKEPFITKYVMLLKNEVMIDLMFLAALCISWGITLNKTLFLSTILAILYPFRKVQLTHNA